MKIFQYVLLVVLCHPVFSQMNEVYELFPDTTIELNDSNIQISGYDDDYNYFEIEGNYHINKYRDFTFYEVLDKSFVVFKSDYWIYLLGKDGSIFHGARRNQDDRAPTEGIYKRFGAFESSSFFVEELKNIEIQYDPSRLLDWDIRTGWVEGARGDGIGETLSFSLKNKSRTSSLIFYNGFIEPRNIDLFYKNARLKDFSIQIDSGEIYNFTLEDSPNEQIVYLPEKSNSFILTILSSYPGSKYSDLAINGLYANMHPDYYEIKF
ncbi:NADase-type glycan-binding domain-containing protein [Spirochaeta isovalerica]|uniref:NAD glycohydrolase translocation F5/8 type C domain-containing protein n=1 Tax=Spirochaeta isovalerica TaxID=150 RepID=A0A841RAE5_9SPIO|nr:hypothetical protein [Spirochaeta isovalerica]MBB6480883.1 hypothetical protein [Spirochaeta isovalerica]